MTSEIDWRKAVASWGTTIAEHPSTCKDVLSELAEHDDVEVRTAVADHCNTSLETILNLAKDNSVDLRYAIAENHNIDVDVLHLLTEDDNPFVAHRAKKTLERIKGVTIVTFPLTADQPVVAARLIL